MPDDLENSNQLSYSCATLVASEVILNQDGVPGIVTCMEALGPSIYVGTKLGEIVHFFRADDGNGIEPPTYIIASWQKTYTKKPRSVSRIMLLPTVSTALALSASITSVFTLPEFAPIADIGSMRDVRSVSRDIDEEQQEKMTLGSRVSSPEDGVLVTVFTKNAIRIVGVKSNTLIPFKKIDYKGVVVGVRRSSFALVSNAESYDLVDMENIQKIPLVPVATATSVHADEEDTADTATIQSNGSTGSHLLQPHICPIGTNEFLITTGTKPDEPAVGLVVNTSGDITRGTISWDAYPSSVAVDYPNVAATIGCDIHIYSLVEQKQIQTINFEAVPIICNVYSPYSIPSHRLADKLMSVTLVAANITPEEQNREIEEKDRALKLSTISSSIFIYSKEHGIQCLVSSPELFDLERRILDGQSEVVLNEMEKMEIGTELDIVQMEYLNLFIALNYLRREDYTGALSFWIGNQSLDPRIILYLYDQESIVGQVWVPSGVREFVGQIKSSSTKLERNEPQLSFFHSFINAWLKKRDLDSITNRSNTFASLELAKLKLVLDPLYHTGSLLMAGNELNDMINNQIIESADRSIDYLIKYERYFDLSRFYRQRKMYREVLEIWKKLLTHEWEDSRFIGGDDKMYHYLITLEDEELVWEYAVWLLKLYPIAGLKIFTDDRSVVKFDEAKVVETLKSLEDDGPWRRFLKYLVYEKKSKLFAGDLIFVMIDDIIDKLREPVGQGVSVTYKDTVKEGIEQYRKLTLPKRSYMEFLRGQKIQAVPGADFGTLRLELSELLSVDDNYDVQKAKQRLESEEATLLILERSIVYSRMGLSEKCLGSLCHDLTDYATATSYCDFGKMFIPPAPVLISQGPSKSVIYPEHADAAIQKNLFSLLYKNLMDIDDPETQDVCVRFLFDHHGVAIDLDTVLAKSSDSWPVELMGGYLVGIFRVMIEEKNGSVLARTLARSENVNISKQLRELQLKVEDGTRETENGGDE